MRILKQELYRAFCNWQFIVSIAIGLAIVLVQFALYTIPAMKYLNLYEIDSGLIPHSVFNQWFGSSTSVCLILYYVALPILTSFPYADSYFWDKKSGYWKNIVTRCEKRRYLNAKFVAVFLSAGGIAIIPTSINLLLNMIVLPSIRPLAAFGIYPIDATSMFGSIFYSHPYFYILILFAMNFLGFGAISVIALPFSFVFTNRFMVVMSPFLVYYSLSALSDLIGFPSLSPMNFLRFDQPARGTSFFSSVCIVLAFLVVSYCLYLYMGLKSDDLQ